jgi:hypothetical protein
MLHTNLGVLYMYIFIMINVYTFLENRVDSVWSLLNQTTNISCCYENIIIVIIVFYYWVLGGLTWSHLGCVWLRNRACIVYPDEGMQAE